MTDGDSRNPEPSVLPQLRYDRPIEAIAWLGRTFGFVEQSRMSGPNGELYISVVVAPGGGTMMIAGPVREQEKAQIRAAFSHSRAVDESRAEESRPNLSYSITLIVPDVDAHYEQARAGGAHIMAPPRDQPWGLRDYEALDLEGRWWNFSQRIREVQPEDWGADRIS